MSHFLIHAARLQDAGVSILTVTLHVRKDRTRMMTVAPSGRYSPEVQRKFPARDFELFGTDRALEQLTDDMAYSDDGPTPEKLAAAIAAHPVAADDLNGWYADWLLSPPLTDEEIADLPEVTDSQVDKTVQWVKGVMKGLDISKQREAMKTKENPQ
jgi:hypothetical protein